MKQSLRNKFGVGNHEKQRQGQANFNFMEPSIVKEAPKVKEFPHATIEAKEIVEIHVEKETSKEEPCCIMSGKRIKIKEKERVEEKREISRKIINDECRFNIANYASCGIGVEDKGRSKEKELGTILEELPISLSLNLSLMCYEVSFVKLKLFLDSYLSHVSIIGDLCTISFGGCLFLVVPYVSKCLYSHAVLEDPLMSSGVEFNPSCYGFGMKDDTSLVEPNIIGFVLESAFLFEILHYECLRKFIEDVDYMFPSLMLS
ncbi:hypothetical protein M9H77_02290 [Catharanthus roseus]|uniref:Uncharacterized protein n=1 Tax=Catharanthus roseus TaxID=4058 RepID=A0ACC0C8E2_CATRO|nr:hypothetical protein M9H77_02290 [Catharanthus roseus]